MQALQPHKHVESLFGVALAKKADGMLAIVPETWRRVWYRSSASRADRASRHCVAQCAAHHCGRRRCPESGRLWHVTRASQRPLKWMAPEQAQRYSAKSDVNSFATTLFELFTQRKPWADLSNNDAALAIVSGETLRWPADCGVRAA